MEVSELMQSLKEVFDPVAKRLGLNGPIEMQRSHIAFSLAYENPEIGVEIEVEMLKFFIFAVVYRPTGGALPVSYKDTIGKRQRLYLQEALKELAIDVAQETRTLQNLGGDYRNYLSMATLLADLLDRHWPRIAANTTRWFA